MDFVWACVESIDQSGEKQHLNNIESSDSWTCYISKFIQIFIFPYQSFQSRRFENISLHLMMLFSLIIQKYVLSNYMSSTVSCMRDKQISYCYHSRREDRKQTSKQIDFVTITLYDNKVYEGNNASQEQRMDTFFMEQSGSIILRK